MEWDNHKKQKLSVVTQQLDMYCKSSSFYEDEITALYLQWSRSLDGDPQTATTLRTKLLEANKRYNYLVTECLNYIRDLEYDHPEVFQQYISEFELRDGWYDPYINNDSELFD